MPDDLESTFVLNGALGPDLAALMRQVMATAGGLLQLTLQEKSPDDKLSAGEWAMLVEPGTNTPTGRIKIQLPSTSLARQFEDTLHGMPFQVGGKTTTVDVHNAALHTLPTGNVQGPGQSS